jgi:cyanophycinase
MDTELLRLVGGPVVVTALAASPGRQYAVATAHGVRHVEACGAEEVTAAPDVRENPAAVDVLREARLLVLPGGSPSRLLAALQPLADLLGELVAGGGGVMGASAGAMVLGSWTFLPDTGRVERGLGLVPGVAVVPHWNGGSGRGAWLRALGSLPEPTRVLGLPEESGVLFHGGSAKVVGQSAAHLVGAGTDVEVGSLLLP